MEIIPVIGRESKTIKVPIKNGPSEEMLSLASQAIHISQASDVDPHYSSRLLEFVVPIKPKFLILRNAKLNSKVAQIKQTSEGEWVILGEFYIKHNFDVKTSYGDYCKLPKNTIVKFKLTYRPGQSGNAITMSA